MDQQEYIILVFGCGNKKTEHRIDLHTKKIDQWASNRLKTLSFKIKEVSAIIIGPKTCIQIYSGDNYYGERYDVINDSPDKRKIYRFGCFEDGEIWRGSLGSFIIWSFDEYNRVYGIRYCDNNRQCRVNERCLCQNGQEHNSWCPNTKKRCMHQSKFWYELPVILSDKDVIDMNCFNKELKKVGNSQASVSLIKDLERRCAKEKLKTIEPFEGTTIPTIIGTIIILFLIICVLLPGKIFLL